MPEQQGDVRLFQTADNGDIEIVDGVVTMSGGLETAAYISLFGGNEGDDARADSTQSWWANLSEVDPDRKYGSETQNLLRSIPATTGNLLRIEDAVRRDLAWFLESRIASSVEVSVTMPGLNTVKIAIVIEALGEENRFEFVENWKSTGEMLDLPAESGVVSTDEFPVFFLLENGDSLALEDGSGLLQLE